MKSKIHIFGASGSGTTTIGAAIAKRLDYKHFDTDDYYWYPTEPPFTKSRPIEERLQLMRADLNQHENWVLSGSLDGWGNPLITLFELVVFVYVPQDMRIERLKQREVERYGQDVLPDGIRYESANEFIKWAAGYDSGLLTGRSLPRHEKWMDELDCEVLKIVNHSLCKSVDMVMEAVRK